jgi:hypothetical protein
VRRVRILGRTAAAGPPGGNGAPRRGRRVDAVDVVVGARYGVAADHHNVFGRCRGGGARPPGLVAVPRDADESGGRRTGRGRRSPAQWSRRSRHAPRAAAAPRRPGSRARAARALQPLQPRTVTGAPSV